MKKAIERISLECSNSDKQSPRNSIAEIKIDKLGHVIRNDKKKPKLWGCHHPMRAETPSNEDPEQLRG